MPSFEVRHMFRVFLESRTCLTDLRKNYSVALSSCQGFWGLGLLHRRGLLSGFPPKGEQEDDKAETENAEEGDGTIEQDCGGHQIGSVAAVIEEGQHSQHTGLDQTDPPAGSRNGGQQSLAQTYEDRCCQNMDETADDQVERKRDKEETQGLATPHGNGKNGQSWHAAE